MTLDDILLYSEISAFPSHHQRCSLLQYMGANTESTTDDMQRVRALGTCSPKWDVSIKFLMSRIREN